MAKMTPLLLRLEPELIARIDEARGDVPRALFIRKRLGELYPEPDLLQRLATVRRDAGRAQEADDRAVAVKRTKAFRKMMKVVEEMPPHQRALDAKTQREIGADPKPELVQYGPTKRKPGELAKGSKK